MQHQEKYEPIVLNLSRTQEVRKQPKKYFLLFVTSFILFSVCTGVAVWYLLPVHSPSSIPEVMVESPSHEDTVPEIEAVATPTPVPSQIPETPVPAVVQSPVETPVETGRLTLISYPEHAEISVNGTVLGKTPLEDYVLAPGAYPVTFVYNGQSSQKTLTIEAGKTTEYIHRFSGFGSLQITTTTSGCEVQINGQVAGESPLLVEGLSPGEYHIVIKKVGYHTAEKTLVLHKGEHQDLFITVRRLGSRGSSGATTVTPSRPLHPSERLQN